MRQESQKFFRWVTEATVFAIHEAQLAEHGGIVGVRDTGLLQSALSRPQNLASYGSPDLAACAAAYAYGIAKNHPFLDGNKRTAYVVMELFLAKNGYRLMASDADATLKMLALSGGYMEEDAYADWLRANVKPRA